MGLSLKMCFLFLLLCVELGNGEQLIKMFLNNIYLQSSNITIHKYTVATNQQRERISNFLNWSVSVCFTTYIMTIYTNSVTQLDTACLWQNGMIKAFTISVLQLTLDVAMALIRMPQLIADYEIVGQSLTSLFGMFIRWLKTVNINWHLNNTYVKLMFHNQR